MKGEELTRVSVGSVSNVLGGQMTGLTTVQYSGEPGADAAEIFIPKLIEEGYQLVTIHELAKIKGTELQTGIAYGDFTG